MQVALRGDDHEGLTTKGVGETYTILRRHLPPRNVPLMGPAFGAEDFKFKRYENGEEELFALSAPNPTQPHLIHPLIHSNRDSQNLECMNLSSRQPQIALFRC